MFSTSLVAAGALAWQASALLLPADVPEDVGIALTQALKYQVVDLDCPNCPFAGPKDDSLVWTQEDSPIQIHLEIDVTDDDQFLQINGQPVFPPPETLIPMALEAEQIRSSDGAHTEPLRLGYALEILPSISEVTDVVLTPIQLTILDIQGVSVEVDTLKIDLIQTWGQIHIAGIDTIPYSQSPGVDQCTNSICRLRAITADRLRRIIDAARARASQAKSWVKNGCPGMKHAHPGAEEHHTEWHHPHTHHRQGHFRQFVDQTVHLFILPALLGIAGGLVACALGMLVGHALARCMISRSGREGRRLEPENLEAAVERDEKDALMDSGEMPPEYEDVEVVVVEEK